MIKKTLTFAEMTIIRLDSSDVIVTSDPFSQPIDPDKPITGDNDGNIYAPSRFNYRGAEVDWEE